MRRPLALAVLACACRTDADSSEPQPAPPVFNEVVAHNVEGLTDEVGEHEDWIELYNSTAQPVDLGGWSLTDALGTATPWMFPDGIELDPGEYVVVFCDTEPDQGELHADFQLSVQGETVDLLDPDGVLQDQLRFGILLPDLAWARIPDGGTTWEWLHEPTPGESNGD